MPTETEDRTDPAILPIPTRGTGLLVVDADRATRVDRPRT